jgi:uncharacterized membrane protein
MKYQLEVKINKPVEKVVELFITQENLFKWMPGLKNLELIEGERGKPGSKTKLLFDMNGKEVEMIETLRKSNLPEEFTATFEAKGVVNNQTTRFEKIDENNTRYISDNEFIFSGLMKILSLMPGVFKKQSMKYLEAFKEFAENEG